MNPQKLGLRGGPVTHLPVALGQLLHLMLLGLQDLLHLGAEGQVPGVTLESRGVSAAALQDLRPTQAGPAPTTLHSSPPRPGMQGSGCPRKEGVSGQLPQLKPRLWQQETDPASRRTGLRGHSDTSRDGRRIYSRPPPTTPHWPITGPTAWPGEEPGGESGQAVAGAHLSLQLLLILADPLLHLFV